MAQALERKLKQMGRGPEARGCPALPAVLVFSAAKEIPFFVHEFVLPLICYPDPHPLKKIVEIKRVKLLNTGYTKDITSSVRVVIKIKFNR